MKKWVGVPPTPLPLKVAGNFFGILSVFLKEKVKLLYQESHFLRQPPHMRYRGKSAGVPWGVQKRYREKNLYELCVKRVTLYWDRCTRPTGCTDAPRRLRSKSCRCVPASERQDKGVWPSP